MQRKFRYVDLSGTQKLKYHFLYFKWRVSILIHNYLCCLGNYQYISEGDDVALSRIILASQS